jgi:hypothetical protein
MKSRLLSPDLFPDKVQHGKCWEGKEKQRVPIERLLLFSPAQARLAFSIREVYIFEIWKAQDY